MKYNKKYVLVVPEFLDDLKKCKASGVHKNDVKSVDGQTQTQDLFDYYVSDDEVYEDSVPGNIGETDNTLLPKTPGQFVKSRRGESPSRITQKDQTSKTVRKVDIGGLRMDKADGGGLWISLK